MLNNLMRRAKKSLLFAVALEVPDQKKLFSQIFQMMKPGGKLLFAEPLGHVKPEDFANSLHIAQNSALKISTEKPALQKQCVILEKTNH